MVTAQQSTVEAATIRRTGGKERSPPPSRTPPPTCLAASGYATLRDGCLRRPAKNFLE
ncbi:MAG: hypothetical protein MUO30_01845 [Anaerolineales bacterium]|nr:hypothetical protein [Anaerolineales bacterium]